MQPDEDDAGDGPREASGAGVLIAIGVIGILIIFGFIFSVASGN